MVSSTVLTSLVLLWQSWYYHNTIYQIKIEKPGCTLIIQSSMLSVKLSNKKEHCLLLAANVAVLYNISGIKCNNFATGL